MSSVVTFGEVMMRLATQRRERFTQSREFEVTYGGGECNVAVSLSLFGIDTTFISAIPKKKKCAIQVGPVHHIAYGRG